MVKEYEKGKVEFVREEEYVEVVCDELEMVQGEMIIDGITGDGGIELMVGGMWSVKKWEVLNAINGEVERGKS